MAASHPGSLAFCGFSMGSNEYWAGRDYDLCVYYMTGTPEGSTESGLIEKPGIEPVTPGLQDIGLSPTQRLLHKVMGNALPEPFFSTFIMLTESHFTMVSST